MTNVTVVYSPNTITLSVASGGNSVIAAGNSTWEVANEAAMLALPASKGDIAVRTDINTTFSLWAAPATVLSNWIELLSPSGGSMGAVQSVFGRTGNVVAEAGDYSADQISDLLYELDFTDASLGVGILTVYHNQNLLRPGNVTIWNQIGKIVIPDDIRVIDADNIEIHLQSYTPLTGTWKLTIGR